MRVLASAAAALLGAGLILAELAFTRLYGYVYSSDRVFLLSGLGALGLAAGGFFAHRVGWHPRRRPLVLAAGAAVAGTVTLLTAIAGASGMTTFLASLPLGLPELLAAYLLFITLGVALAAASAVAPAAARWTGGMLFGGAALAAVLFPALAGALQPPTVALLAAALIGLVALPAALVALRSGPKADAGDDADAEVGGSGRALGAIASVVLALVPVGAFASQLPLRWLAADPAAIVSPKPLFQSVGLEADGERLVHSAWDGHSRTDVTEHPRQPLYGWIYQDGEFTGRVIRSGAPTDLLRQDIGYLPFLLPGGTERVLVVGAGGGQEVAAALTGGAREVIVADAAPALRDSSVDALSGGVFGRSGVQFVGEDARTYLRAGGGMFDLIYLTLSTAGAPQPGGATAGAGLLTIEAFATYMNALKPDGRLVMQLRDQEDMLRAFSTAYQTWLRLGAGQVEAARRIVVYNNQPLAEAQQQGGASIVLPLMTVRRTPYQQPEIESLVQALQQTPYLPIFLPHAEQQSAQIYPLLVGIVQAGPSVIEANVPVDIRAATDSRPFFYDSTGALPLVPLGVLLVCASLTGALALLFRRPEGESVVISDDVDTRAAAFLEQRVPWRFLGFAALAGAAWGFLVLPLLHRVPQLIGQPLLTGPVVYGGLLGGAALGTLLAAPARLESMRPVIGWAGLAGGVLAVGILELLPLVSGSVGGLPLAARSAVLVALLVPLGACLGIPLPGAVRLLSGAQREGWVALLTTIALFGAATARYFAYVSGVAWTLSIPTILGGLCLFGAFLMAGLRALAISTDEPEPEVPAAPTLDEHAPWKKPTL